ncbi:hypothetical protein [Taibaiella koreensis]|uniref:hypothetical protein n=1 Tax=Taibaiella koreensis TaxID=1268548 RepID=UPI000E59D65F|nr:hypothetical protein [Taibaiella koreensis]
MQELINELIEKANLSPEAAAKAVETTVNFVKSKLPPFLSDKVEDLIGGKFDLGSMFGGFGGGDAGDSPLDKLNNMFGDKK